MRLATHAVGGVAFWLVGATLAGRPADLASIAAAAAGALIPEVDDASSLVGKLAGPLAVWLETRYGHRGPTHSLLGLLTFMALTSPLAFFGLWSVLIALGVGYLSHLVLDAMTLDGVLLFWPATYVAVLPGRDELRLDTEAPNAHRKELVVFGVLFVIAAAFAPLSQVGLTGALQRALGTMEETFTEYRKLAGSYEVFLVGSLQDQITGAKREGEWLIVSLVSEGYLVQDGERIRLVGQRGNLVPLRVTVKKGQPITVITTNVSFSGRLSSLLTYIDPEVEHFISGRIALARSVSLPSDPEAFATVRGSSELSLSFARWQDLAPLSSEYATEATLVIVHRLRAGQSLRPGGASTAAVGESASGPLIPVTITVKKLSDLVVEEDQWVAEGDPLAQDSDQIAEAQRALEAAQARHKLGLLSDEDYSKAVAEAYASEERATIRSPITGTIEQIVVESGSSSGITVRLFFRRTDVPPSAQTTTAFEQIDPKYKELPELPRDQGEVAYVLRVLDGDTVELLYQGRAEKARLVGVDTPETKDPRKPVQCYGPEASQFTSTTLPRGTEVRITWNPLGDKRDKYKRLLVYLWVQLDDDEPLELFNAALVRLGYARVYPFFKFDRLQEFRNLEAAAMAEKAGLWGACGYEPYQK